MVSLFMKKVVKKCINCGKNNYSNYHDDCATCRSKRQLGKRYGGIVIIGIGKWRSLIAKCDCGKEFQVKDRSALDKGKLTSCGCHIHMNRVRKKSGLERSVHHVFSMAKLWAKKRKIPWNLSKEEWYKITQKPCFYCGDPHGNLTKGRYRKDGTRQADFKYNGIDRYNNELPYDLENCVPCCKRCNTMKGSLSHIEFLNHLIRILKYDKSRKNRSA